MLIYYCSDNQGVDDHILQVKLLTPPPPKCPPLFHNTNSSFENTIQALKYDSGFEIRIQALKIRIQALKYEFSFKIRIQAFKTVADTSQILVGRGGVGRRIFNMYAFGVRISNLLFDILL